MNKEVIEVRGNLYQVVRKIKESQVNGNVDGLKAWREILHCDTMFNSNGMYYLVKEITDIKIENE